MINVAILLSTFNSEKYLSQQIQSIINQTYKNWDLFIRDDGSTDSTIDLIENYCKKNTNVIFLNDNMSLGVKNSYIYLLSHVEAHYYMYCDHDDYWFPTKIECTLNRIKELEYQNSNVPILVHTDLSVVDENLNLINNSFWKYSKLKPQMLSNYNFLCVNNCITGCTVMFNDLAKKLIVPIPSEAIMHDWWSALIVSKFGKVDYLNQPTIYYRQHSRNVVGARNIGIGYYFHRLKELKIAWKENLEVYEMSKKVGFNNPCYYLLIKFYFLFCKCFCK